MYLEWINEVIGHDTSFHQNGLKELPLLNLNRSASSVLLQYIFLFFIIKHQVSGGEKTIDIMK